MLRDRFPEAAGRARVLRKEGDWHTVAKVEAPTCEGEPTIWKSVALAALGIEGAEARSVVASTDPSRQASSVQWCL